MVEQVAPLVPIDLSTLPPVAVPTQDEIERFCSAPFAVFLSRNEHGRWPRDWRWGNRDSDPYSIRQRPHQAVDTFYFHNSTDDNRDWFDGLIHSMFGLVREVTLDRVQYASRRGKGFHEDAFHQGITAVAEKLRDPTELDELADAMGLRMEHYDLPNGDSDFIIHGEAQILEEYVRKTARNQIDQWLFNERLLKDKPKRQIKTVQQTDNIAKWFNYDEARRPTRRSLGKRWRGKPSTLLYYRPQGVDVPDEDLNDQDKLILAMFRMNFTNKEIAEKLDCHPSTIGRRLRRIGARRQK